MHLQDHLEGEGYQQSGHTTVTSHGIVRFYILRRTTGLKAHLGGGDGGDDGGGGGGYAGGGGEGEGGGGGGLGEGD